MELRQTSLNSPYHLFFFLSSFFAAGKPCQGWSSMPAYHLTVLPSAWTLFTFPSGPEEVKSLHRKLPSSSRSKFVRMTSGGPHRWHQVRQVCRWQDTHTATCARTHMHTLLKELMVGREEGLEESDPKGTKAAASAVSWRRVTGGQRKEMQAKCENPQQSLPESICIGLHSFLLFPAYICSICCFTQLSGAIMGFIP